MAMWNAPSDDDHHVDNACRGALSALAVSEDLNEELEKAWRANYAYTIRTSYRRRSCR